MTKIVLNCELSQFADHLFDKPILEATIRRRVMAYWADFLGLRVI